MFAKRRVILIIMDSVGAGELPDAGRYGDTGSHTLNHIFERYPQMNLPNRIFPRSVSRRFQV